MKQNNIPSTLRSITKKKAHFNANYPVVAKYSSYPTSASKRFAEGGMRLNGYYKASYENMPLVTIITVCLNAQESLERTFQSVFTQDYDNIEYIVIDGASSDRSLEIIEANKDKIDYYVSEEDKGLYEAINKGLMLASGEYVLILNADDTYTEDAVSSLVKAKIESACDFVSAHALFLYADTKRNFVFDRISYNPTLRFCMPIRHETMLISAKLYNEIGFYDTRYKIIADWVFCKKLFDAKKTMFEVRQALLNFSTNGISMQGCDNIQKERVKFIKESFPFLDEEDLLLLVNRESIMSEEYFYRVIEKYSHEFDFVEGLRCDLLLYRFYKNKEKRMRLEQESSLV